MGASQDRSTSLPFCARHRVSVVKRAAAMLR
jgi:hypothetical protein